MGGVTKHIKFFTKMATEGETIIRRNRAGTKAENFYNWPEQDFNDMDTTLAVQQYIQQLIRKDYKNIDTILEAPAGQDEASWKYEHLRQFCSELNLLAVRLLEECDPQVCKKMTATEEWIFLCAAHPQPKDCSALDYTLHTLHGAASLLNSNKFFPSRVSIKENSVQKLSSIARRVYRIFSHAYYHHRELFDNFEEATYLCKRFTVYVTKYELMTSDNLIVPIIITNTKEEKQQQKQQDDNDDDENNNSVEDTVNEHEIKEQETKDEIIEEQQPTDSNPEEEET